MKTINTPHLRMTILFVAAIIHPLHLMILHIQMNKTSHLRMTIPLHPLTHIYHHMMINPHFKTMNISLIIHLQASQMIQFEYVFVCIYYHIYLSILKMLSPLQFMYCWLMITIWSDTKFTSLHVLFIWLYHEEIISKFIINIISTVWYLYFIPHSYSNVV